MNDEIVAVVNDSTGEVVYVKEKYKEKYKSVFLMADIFDKIEFITATGYETSIYNVYFGEFYHNIDTNRYSFILERIEKTK